MVVLHTTHETATMVPVSRRSVLKGVAGALTLAAVPFGWSTRAAGAAQATGIQPGDTIEVVDGPLNLREGPGLEYAVIIAFDEGTRFRVGDGPIAADGYTWVEIVPGGDAPPGWLASEFVQKVNDDSPGSPSFIVVDGPLNVRTGPGLDYEIIDTVPTGARGQASAPDSTLADGYSWAQVTFNSSLSGWIALDFVAWL